MAHIERSDSTIGPNDGGFGRGVDGGQPPISEVTPSDGRQVVDQGHPEVVPSQHITSPQFAERAGSIPMAKDTGEVRAYPPREINRWWVAPGSDAASLRHTPVTDFVLDNVQSTEELNAPSREEGEERFNEVAGAAIAALPLGEPVGFGGLCDVHRVPGHDDILLKRYKVGEKNKVQTRDEATIDAAFTAIALQHDALTDIYSPEHVPESVFVKVGVDFGPESKRTLHGEDNMFLEGTEYLHVEENVRGVMYQHPAVDNEADLREAAAGATDEMREQVADLVQRYRGASLRPDGNQIIYDFDRNKVKIIDTNNPWEFDSFFDINSYFTHIGVDPHTITTPRQFADTVVANTPAFAHLQGMPWEEVRAQVLPGSALAEEAYAQIPNSFTVADFRMLLEELEHFPPEGDNTYIRTIVDAFQLEDSPQR